MNKIVGLICFVAGAATGYLASKKHFKKIADDEIAEIREHYRKKEEIDYEKYTQSKSEQYIGEEAPSDDLSNDEYDQVIRDSGYSNESDEPYVISPEAFGELEDEGYDSISLTYYADGILADDTDDVIDDIQGTVGKHSLTMFGEYEDDAVHVRNERLKTDYEILRDSRYYSDIHGD